MEMPFAQGYVSTFSLRNRNDVMGVHTRRFICYGIAANKHELVESRSDTNLHLCSNGQ